uniref:Neur_chan_LBD domain-containing protein n=1 Tax=Macrostomum lignano TaxID=282301 RepID=A0A1I8F3I4_9PLAT
MRKEIVGALLDPKQYNKNHRPLNRWTGQAASNNSRNHQNMDFTVNIYLRMIWEDARLAYSASNPNASVSLHSMKDKIWMPDIFFRNAKQVENHADPVPNILVKLRPTGRIYFSQLCSYEP